MALLLVLLRFSGSLLATVHASAALQCRSSFLPIPHGLVLENLQTVGRLSLHITLDINTSLSKAEL